MDENIIKLTRADFDLLVEACEAAIKYDNGIIGKAMRGEVDLQANGSGIAVGEDLDALYFDWQRKSHIALKAVKGENAV